MTPEHVAAAVRERLDQQSTYTADLYRKDKSSYSEGFSDSAEVCWDVVNVLLTGMGLEEE